jgi:hypothetical protein
MIACHREPTLAEMLSDPVIQSAMAADGVDPSEVKTLLHRIHATRLDGRQRFRSEHGKGHGKTLLNC